MELLLSHWTIKRTHVACISLLSLDLKYDETEGVKEKHTNIHHDWHSKLPHRYLCNSVYHNGKMYQNGLGMYVFIIHISFCHLPTFIIDKKILKWNTVCIDSAYGLTEAQKLLAPFVFSVFCMKLVFGFSLLPFSSHLLLSFTLFYIQNASNFLTAWEVGWILEHIRFTCFTSKSWDLQNVEKWFLWTKYQVKFYLYSH